MPNRLANYTGHDINILPSSELGTPRYDIKPNLVTPARAVELSRLMGFVSVAGVNIPIIEMTHAGTDGLPPPAPDVLGVASLDTLRARFRDAGNIRGYAAPDDIVRDQAGMILGAQGLAVPHTEPTLWPERTVMLEDNELSDIAPPADWLNFAPFPMRLYAPETPDVIDAAAVEPILDLPPDASVGIRRNRELSPELTDRFAVPVVRTTYGEVLNLQFPKGREVALIQQEAVRAYVKLGLPVRHLVVLGDAVRNAEGHILGGRSIKVYAPEMLVSDPF